MEERKEHFKGGRLEKAAKSKELLGLRCSVTEKFLIQTKAEELQLTFSEYLREMGLSGKIDIPKKVLPKEVSLFTATLNHMAANLNQIAKKRNSFEELNALERAELHYLSGQVKQLAKDIKTYLQ